MPPLVLLEGRARLVVRGDALVVEVPDRPPLPVRTATLSEVHLYGRADATPDARNRLLRERVDLVFFTADGRLRGRLSAVESRQAGRRLAQYRTFADPSAAADFARAIVRSKIDNQRRILRNRQRYLQNPTVAAALVLLRTHTLPDDADLDATRGHEGLAAARYFGVFQHLITADTIPWTGRNRRPPRDPVNAALSYGYALLQAEVDRAVRHAALDPWLGALHAPIRNAPALVLDLMEEARPAVDDVVLTLFNRRQLQLDDFGAPKADEDDPAPADAVHLQASGRERLLRAWERALNRPTPHPSRDGTWALRELLREQAHQVARRCDGDTTPWSPLVLRPA